MKKLLLIFILFPLVSSAHVGVDWHPQNWFLEKFIDFFFLVAVTLTSAALAYYIRGEHEIKKFRHSKEFDKGRIAFKANNYLKAIQIWRPLAEEGYAEAQFVMGMMYRKGVGVIKNNKQAISWYKKSAEQGNANAQFNLAYMYEKGKSVKKNDELAFNWYMKSAEQGNERAQNEIARMYNEGIFVESDKDEALKWLYQAADMGHAPAQNNLGYIKEMMNDYEEAKKWYTQAAKQGLAPSQYNLGRLYAYYLFEKSDDGVKAYMWLRIADSNGHEGAQKVMNELKETMSADKIEEAERMASEYTNSDYQNYFEEGYFDGV